MTNVGREIMNDDSNVPIRINQYWEQKREKINEIIYDLMKENIREFDPGREDNHLWPRLEEIINRLQNLGTKNYDLFLWT